MFHQIPPFVSTVTKTITQISLEIIEIILFTSITIRIQYLDADGVFCYDPKLLRSVVIEGEEYEAWERNDGYIINLVMQKIQDSLNPMEEE